MNDVVVPFPHGQQLRTPLAQFFRIGESHRKFGDMFASDHFPVSRVVIDAGRLKQQSSLVQELKSEGVEISIDTGAAELSSAARHRTFVRKASWLLEPPSTPLTPSYFDESAIVRMAEMAVSNRVDRILAPTHFLGDPNFDGWLKTDAEACTILRSALDKLGGGRIRIDYTIIQSVQGLIGPAARKELLETISILPVDAIWVRLSGLGKEPRPQKIRAFIRMLGGFHNLGKPVILDYCGGLNAEAAEAFGVASGVAGGILELDQFSARDWHKLPDEPDPETEIRRARIVPLLGLSRGFRANEFELLARARGGRKLLLQSDYVNAASVEEMVTNRKQIQALQMALAQEDLQDVPDLNRAGHFLSKTMARAERRAKDISFLKPTKAQASEAGVDLTSLLNRTRDHAVTMGKVADALEKIHEERGADSPRVRACDLNIEQALRRDGQG